MDIIQICENVVIEMLKKGHSIDLILEELRNRKIPPGISITAIERAFNVSYKEASELVYKSKAYEGFGRLNDLFLDKLTGEDNPKE